MQSMRQVRSLPETNCYQFAVLSMLPVQTFLMNSETVYCNSACHTTLYFHPVICKRLSSGISGCTVASSTLIHPVVLLASDFSTSPRKPSNHCCHRCDRKHECDSVTEVAYFIRYISNKMQMFPVLGFDASSLSGPSIMMSIRNVGNCSRNDTASLTKVLVSYTAV
jgi:hypothetical protein